MQHHCHHCGKVFCEQCTSKTVVGSKSSRPHPVCDKCYVILNKDSTSTFYDTTLADDKRWLLWNGVLWLSYVTQQRRRIVGHDSFVILLHGDKNKLTMSGIIFITVSRTEPLVLFCFICLLGMWSRASAIKDRKGSLS